MTPPDARVLIVATLIIVGVPVAVHEYRIHAHHQALARGASTDARLEWGARSSGDGNRAETRGERASAPDGRPGH